MKKLIALILVTIFAFSLVACGGENTAKDLGGFDTPDAAVEALIAADSEQDVDTYVSVYIDKNKNAVLTYTSFTGNQKDTLADGLDKTFEYLKAKAERVPKKSIQDVKLTSEILGKNSIDSKSQYTLENIGLLDAITDFAIVNCTATINGRSDVGEFSCVKIGEKWYVSYYYWEISSQYEGI